MSVRFVPELRDQVWQSVFEVRHPRCVIQSIIKWSKKQSKHN